MLPPLLPSDTRRLPVRVPAGDAGQKVHLERYGGTVWARDHVGQEGVKALQTIAPSDCGVVWVPHTIAGVF